MKKIYNIKTEIEKLSEIFEDNDLKKISGNNDEHINDLEEAQEKIYSALAILESVANDTNNDYARTYLIDHLKIMAGEGHGFMSRDFNIDKWKEQLQNPEEEYDEELELDDEQEKIRKEQEDAWEEKTRRTNI